MAKRGIHATQNSFHWLCSEFLASSKFAGMALNSQKNWSRELYDASRVLGRALLKAKNDEEEKLTIRPKMVLDYLGALLAPVNPETGPRRAKARNALSALRALSKWAEVSDLINRDFVRGVTVPHPGGGHIPWTDEQVQLALTHARWDLARVILMASCTGQRRSDLAKMCWLDVRSVKGRQGISVVQKKTGVRLWIPINDTLATAIETWERKDHGRILYDMWGLPWDRPPVGDHRLTNAWSHELRKNPKLGPLRGLVIHGLRGHVCVRLSRAGCSSREIGDMVGMSEKQVNGYTKLASKEENNLATLYRLENFRGTNPRKAESK